MIRVYKLCKCKMCVNDHPAWKKWIVICNGYYPTFFEHNFGALIFAMYVARNFKRDGKHTVLLPLRAE